MQFGKLLHVMFTCTVLAVSMLGVSACHTTQGVGKDIEAAGDAIDDTAAENTTY